MIKNLGLSDDEAENKFVPNHHLLKIFVIPLLIVLPFRNLNILHCSDIICSNGLSESSINFASIYIPISLAIGLIFWLHYKVIKTLKSKWGKGSRITVYDIRELWFYPLGLGVCYVWIYLDAPIFPQNSIIRLLDVIGQQLQGMMHCLVFGMSYETRSYIKKIFKEKTKHWQIFEKVKEIENHSFELQTRLINGPKTTKKRLTMYSLENF